MESERYPIQVHLKDGTPITIRPLVREDQENLLAFFRGLPEEDRLFLREDVTRREVVERLVATIGDESVFRIVAEHQGRIVGEATLQRSRHGWSRHVAQIRVVIARPFQHRGLGTILIRTLVHHAIGLGLEKLVADVVENQMAARRAIEKVGFVLEAVLRKHVQDIHGVKRDLLILSNDCSHIWEAMEHLVADFRQSHGG